MNPISRLYILATLIFNFTNGLIYSQTAKTPKWTAQQIQSANTAKNIAYLTPTERVTILYINLARMYPKEFVKIELHNYNGTAKYGNFLKNSTYKQSLIATLNSMQPVKGLVFDEKLYLTAKCFAKEQGESGQEGHARKNCTRENSAECCSYGMETGKDVAMQLLIDHDVPSLGHRKLCLSAGYSQVGTGTHAHTKWQTCTIVHSK